MFLFICDWIFRVILNVRMFQMVLRRSEGGYGFTICNKHPIRVRTVRPNMAAHLHNLHNGDVIVAINGTRMDAHEPVLALRLIR